MKVSLDTSLCESNGVCVDVAAAVFYFDDQDFLYIREEALTPENEAAVRKAVDMCPRSALTIEG